MAVAWSQGELDFLALHWPAPESIDCETKRQVIVSHLSQHPWTSIRDKARDLGFPSLGHRKKFRGPLLCKHPERKHSAHGLCHPCASQLGEKNFSPTRKEAARLTRARAQRRRALRRFGLDELAFETLFKAQQGLCAICHTPIDPQRRIRNFSVDHNHATGQVRALLCSRCNIHLGIIEKVGFLPAVLRYLKEFDFVQYEKICGAFSCGKELDILKSV